MKLVESFITRNPCYSANMSNADDRYTTFQRRGPLGLVLHSVGCAQPSAKSFADRWDSPSYKVAVHGFIDANSGVVYQTMPWNFRAWHAGGSANNTHVGVEMCESSGIKYRGVSDRFDVIDKEKALKHCKTAYIAAVELFAYLCNKYHLDPLRDGVIISHNEAGKRGVGSGHTDPEHYWTQLGAGYTMDGFRKDVKAAMSGSATITHTIKPVTPDKTITVKVRQLSKGMEGNDVRTLQAALIANGFSCGSAGTDGDFGSGTDAALRKFQTKYGLGADGIAGAGTWGKLLSK